MKNIPKRKAISKLYEKFCQTGLIEKLDWSGKPKNDQNEVMLMETILCKNPQSSVTEFS